MSPNVNQNKQFESAFADEVLAEIARQRGLTAKEVQQRAGITQSTWGNYFRERSTRIPLGVMVAVSDALEVLPEEMMRRARLRAMDLAGSTRAQLEANLSPEAREVVEEGRARAARERAAEGRPTEDPPVAPGEGRRSA